MISNAVGWLTHKAHQRSKQASRCQLKQMVEGLCYINERSLLHLRYLSSWQFMSLLKTYQSFPIIFKEVSCHLHCQEPSFLTSSRPVKQAWGDYDTLTPQGRQQHVIDYSCYINTYLLTIFTPAHMCRDKNLINVQNDVRLGRSLYSIQYPCTLFCTFLAATVFKWLCKSLFYAILKYNLDLN